MKAKNIQNNNAESEFKYEVGQAVYMDTSERLFVIKECYHDWDVDENGASCVGNFYVVGEYGYDNSTIIRAHEARLRPWTLDTAQPGEVIAKSEKPGEYWVGIFKSYNAEFKTLRAYIYTHHDRDDVGEPMESQFVSAGMRPATHEERQILKSKLNKTGYDWNVDQLTLYKPGDAIVCEKRGRISIFRRRLNRYEYEICGTVFTGSNRFEPYSEWLDDKEFPMRHATDEEKQMLADKLREKKYEWDAKSMTLNFNPAMNVDVAEMISSLETRIAYELPSGSPDYKRLAGIALDYYKQGIMDTLMKLKDN